MKSLRRLTILIIFLLVSVATMATGVFAWFIDYGNGASVDSFSAQTLDDQSVLEIDAEHEGIFLGDRIRDLTYLQNDEFDIIGFDFYGHASVLEFVISNPSPNPATARVRLNVVAAPEFGIYAGSQAGLKYLVLEEQDSMSQPNYLANRFAVFQYAGNVFSAMDSHNSNGFTIPGESTKRVYIYIWGAYDGLTQAQKDVYHALVYRVKVLV